MSIFEQSQVNKVNLNKEMEDIASRLKFKTYQEGLYFPKYFQVETTRLCNSRCTFCAVDQWDKTTKFMSDELFNKIVDEMSNYKHWIEVVMVQRAGEPLMDKQIIKRVKALHDAGIKIISMSTNVSMLTEQKARDLIEAGLGEIMLSIDSVERSTYEKTRIGLNYDKVIQNIKTLFKVRDELKPNMIVRVRGVSFYDLEKKEQRNELIAWEDFWGALKKPQDRIYMKRAHNWGNQKDFEDGKFEKNDWVYHPCILPWSTMHITAMGTVALCPQDYDGKMNIGNINTHTIKEVWNNENWTKIRKLHLDGNRNEISFCQGCKLFDLDFKLEDWQQKQLYES